jgi:hypothetical protein
VHALGDDQISISHPNAPTTSLPSVLDENLRGAIKKTAAEFWPGIPVTPTMVAARRTAGTCEMPAFRPTAILDRFAWQNVHRELLWLVQRLSSGRSHETGRNRDEARSADGRSESAPDDLAGVRLPGKASRR